MDVYEIEYGWVDLTYRDLDGNPVKKNKSDNPYSYDSFVVWNDGCNKLTSDVIYSDRLWQWDSKKYNTCCMEVWGNQGQYFNNREPKDIELFLIKYLGKEIKLRAIMEGCNMSSGFPIWEFYFETTDK